MSSKLKCILFLLLCSESSSWSFGKTSASVLPRWLFRHHTTTEASTIDESTAKSAFGTKDYWDDVYTGRGDFPSEQFSWYFGWDIIGKFVRTHISKHSSILIPGIGNDPILIDMLAAGYTRLTAQDYSEYAIERQRDLLVGRDYARQSVQLCDCDVRKLPKEWTNRFDAIIEKGLLDAVYLSGDGHIEQAVQSLQETLKPGGIVVSVSGVVPDDLRDELFDSRSWIWLRDGRKDLQAGCFILQKIR